MLRVPDRLRGAELGSRGGLTSQLGGERGLTTGDFAMMLGLVTVPALLFSLARLFRRSFLARTLGPIFGLESPDAARRSMERLQRYASRRRTFHDAFPADAPDSSAGSAPKGPAR